ncbi:MAG TPA: GntR family transcriptional regulator [Usitatibacter sp.]|nr:GntR family transcriptional regulator [Usitatibacter sp.]
MGADIPNAARAHAVSAEPAPAPDDAYRVARVAAPLRQSVIASLRNAIAAGRFKAGDRLTERDVCEMTGVSRTLVRETFRQLESEGLITVLPHRGPVVSRVTPEQAEGIYQVRAVLEGLASELFALNASDEDLRALRQALKNIRSALDTTDPVAKVNAKNEFYECLFRGTGNEALGQTLNTLNSRIMVLRSTSLQAKGRGKESVKELAALVDALSARDAKAARAAAQVHVENAAKAALDILRREQGQSPPDRA